MECYNTYCLKSQGVQSFQYPRTDRVECYWDVRRGRCGVIGLSVSSDGSCGMLPKGDNDAADTECFQYPRTDRVECYCASCADCHPASFFQYPRTDRVECYRPPGGGRVQVNESFSILGRIVWNATRGDALARINVDGAFSILGRIVWNATLTPWGAGEIRRTFSILGRIVWNATVSKANTKC